jgi:hypothetical protein
VVAAAAVAGAAAAAADATASNRTIGSSQRKRAPEPQASEPFLYGGADETRTRDLLRDRQAF